MDQSHSNPIRYFHRRWNPLPLKEHFRTCICVYMYWISVRERVNMLMNVCVNFHHFLSRGVIKYYKNFHIYLDDYKLFIRYTLHNYNHSFARICEPTNKQTAQLINRTIPSMCRKTPQWFLLQCKCVTIKFSRKYLIYI